MRASGSSSRRRRRSRATRIRIPTRCGRMRGYCGPCTASRSPSSSGAGRGARRTGPRRRGFVPPHGCAADPGGDALLAGRAERVGGCPSRRGGRGRAGDNDWGAATRWVISGSSRSIAARSSDADHLGIEAIGLSDSPGFREHFALMVGHLARGRAAKLAGRLDEAETEIRRAVELSGRGAGRLEIGGHARASPGLPACAATPGGRGTRLARRGTCSRVCPDRDPGSDARGDR